MDGDQLLAGATLVLASATVVLAFFTKRAVDAAQASAEISRLTLQAGLRPVLVDVPLGRFVEREEIRYHELGARQVGAVEDRGEIDSRTPERGDWQDRRLISIPFRNAGPGIAVIRTVPPRAITNESTGWIQGSPTLRIVPPSEIVRLNFLAPETTHVMRVEITYGDSVGEQMTRTRLLVRRIDGRWQVRGLAIHGSTDMNVPAVVWTGEGWDPATGRQEGPLTIEGA